MKFTKLLAASAAAALLAAPAAGQSMPGMSMPMPAKAWAKKASPKKAASKNAKKKSLSSKNMPARKKTSSVKSAGAKPTHKMSMPMPSEQKAPTTPMPIDQHSAHGTMPMPMPGQAPGETASPMPMNPSQVGGMAMPGMGGGLHEMAMTGALGPYPMQRESSGTSWQPDSSEHVGLMTMSGDWMLMAHGVANLVYDHQSGPRGEDKAFASGMLMGMARRPLGKGTLQLKAMISPDPLMGRRGYPLLLASGETANGRTPLIDRQHPHDFFMELSASVSQDIGKRGSIFLYGGLPGEPAFGPPAFMHRESIMDSPEAPISHHWLDSTHISFGVLTGGIVLDRVKLEVSRFNAREPDQHRWNIETGPLDSTAVRLSWNPIRTLSLQGSWGHFTDPEQLEPGVDQQRLSASVLWANEIASGWRAAGTLAWGRKTAEHHSDDAFAAEASLKHRGWTVFGRAEMTENRELLGLQEHGRAYRVGKVSLGAARDFRIADHWSVGAGGLFALDFVPDSIAPLYGGTNPSGLMGFVRLKLD